MRGQAAATRLLHGLQHRSYVGCSTAYARGGGDGGGDGIGDVIQVSEDHIDSRPSPR